MNIFNRFSEFFEANETSFIIGIVLGCALIIIVSVTTYLLLKVRKSYKKLRKSHNDLIKISETDLITNTNNFYKFGNDINDLTKAKEKFYVAALAINEYSTIKNVLGYYNSNEILINLVKYMRDKIPPKTEIYHTCEDKFYLIYNGDDFGKFKNCVQKFANIYFNNDDIEKNFVINVLCSILSCPEDGDNLQDIISNSEIAISYIERNNSRKPVMFDKKLMSSVMEESLISASISKAIKNGDIEMYFQPMVSLFNKEHRGFEALMRFKNFEYGPAEFIPVAEKTGSIIELGKIAITQSFQFINRLENLGFENVRVSINLSGIQLSDPNLISTISEGLKLYNVNPRSIIFEFTESRMFADSQQLEIFIKYLQKNHIDMSLDDFGCGFSSINMLISHDFKYVKFDKSITDTIFKNDSFNDLLKFCKGLDFEVCIEGVETEDQFSFLKNSGVDFIQGYYFSKPLSTDTVIKYLRETKVLG